MLRLSEEVATAVDEGQAVVALESTLISHGLPYPQNLEIALALEAEVRATGAVPATIGVVGGTPTVGLAPADLERFATRGAAVRKLSRRDLAACIAQGADGATTVAATIALAAAAGIAVFATGGIGGVHRGAERSFDVSADLLELARTPVAVVCAGAKALLDLRLTLEVLETHGVPVLGYGTDELPAFWSRSSGLKLDRRLDTPEAVARVLHAKWAAGLDGGVVVANPIPAAFEVPHEDIEALIRQALAEADTAGIAGAALTPWLLARVEALSGGTSLDANVALVLANARLAAQVACALARL